MACVYKRTTQKGHTWYIQYRDSEGKKIRKATEAKTKREAEDELADALIAIKRGQNQCDEGSEAEEQQSEVLFFKICDDFMEYSPAHKRSWWRDEYTVRRLKAFFGNIESSKIQKMHIEQYIAERRNDSPITGAKAKPATTNRELSCLKTIFIRAVESGKMDSNPMKSVDLLCEDNIRDRVLSNEEFNRLVDCSPKHLKPILVTVWETGMRKMEILNLTWNKVDLKNCLIRLNSEDTKSGLKRVVPISLHLHQTLTALEKDHDYVFAFRGSPIRDLRTAFYRACKEAEIEDFWFHDLRHCFITNQRRKGVPDRVIMAITGHRTMECFSRYDTISEEDLKRAVQG